MSELLVQIDRLEKSFPGGERPALQGVSLEVRAGKILGLVGPDGAGKTTLIRIMAGLLLADSGEIRFSTIPGDPDSAAKHARQNQLPAQLIGYMPQKFGLYEDLTVQENLEFNADLRGVIGKSREEAFARLLEFTGLEKFRGRLAGRLSGGMKQKLGLACTLLGQPRILLLDEPGVGVDPISRRDLWNIIRGLAGDGMGIVWGTAYMDEAEGCDEVLVLNEGGVLFRGPPRQLMSRMHNQCYLLRETNGRRRELLQKSLAHPQVQDATILGHSVRIVLRNPGPPPSPDEFGAAPATQVVPGAPRLEDAFIQALGGATGGGSPLAEFARESPGDRASQPETVVEAINLTRRFGTFTAADRICFEVRRGEVFGLLGANGAGKSTTFRMLCGLLAPTAGQARVMGINLQHSPSRARQHLGYMAQKFSLYGNLSVRQNLDFFSGAYGLSGAQRRQATEQMIQVFKLQPLLNHRSDTLPLGFKQRLALACALMHRPDILFLDEPTSGVDPVTRREFWSHINALVGGGVTVVVTTHFMDEAEYCDRLALVHRGKVIAAGRPDELKALAATKNNPEPSMEEAFIRLVESQPEDA
jgi:ABC-2 type transport system ATP-binding protein